MSLIREPACQNINVVKNPAANLEKWDPKATAVPVIPQSLLRKPQESRSLERSQ